MPGCHHGLKMYNRYSQYANRHHQRHLSLLPAVREISPLVEGNGLHKWNASFCLTAEFREMEFPLDLKSKITSLRSA